MKQISLHEASKILIDNIESLRYVTLFLSSNVELSKSERMMLARLVEQNTANLKALVTFLVSRKDPIE